MSDDSLTHILIVITIIVVFVLPNLRIDSIEKEIKELRKVIGNHKHD